MPTSITQDYLSRYGAAAADDPGLLPVTGAQRRFLLTGPADGTGRRALLPLYFEFPRGTVDPVRLRAAAAYLAAAHPALRARFDIVNAVARQRMAAPTGEVRTITTRTGETATEAMHRVLRTWPPHGPALRLFVISDGGERDLLAIVVDHAACDEQSLAVLSAGLQQAYRERKNAESALDEPGVATVEDYRDAVHQQLTAELRASSAADMTYWSGRLAGLRPFRPRGPVAGAATPGHEPTGLLRCRLAAPAEHARPLLFPALLNAVAAAVRPGGVDAPVLVGYPWGGRPLGTAPVLGCFLNTVPFPVRRTDDVGQTNSAWWDDLDHVDTPVDEILRAARARGVLSANTFDGLLTWEDLARRPPLTFAGQQGTEVHLPGPALPAPFVVSVSHGVDLLVHLAWHRTEVTDDVARDAFETLGAALKALLGRPTAGERGTDSPAIPDG
jgi:hypothetical protein